MLAPRATSAASLPLSTLLLALLLAAGCEEDRRVTFGLEPRVEAPRDVPVAEAARFSPRASGDLPRGERRKVVAGAPLSLAAPDIELGSILELDIDADRDLDAIVVTRAEGVAELGLASRDGASYALERLARVTLPAGCAAGPARIEHLEERSVVARVAHACEHGAAETIWALEIARRPRVRETIRVLPPAEGDTPVSVATAVRDIDGDARADLEARFTVGGAAPVALAWLDRPGGFGLNREEPAATLRRVVGEAEAALTREPAAAEAKAGEALAVFRALCREGGAPRVAVGEPSGALQGREPVAAAGVQCDVGALPLRAEAIAAASHVRRGELLAALAIEGGLRGRAGFREVADAVLAPAWATVPTPSSLSARSVLTTEALGGRSEALASLFFEDDRTLVVRGPLTRKVTLDATPRVEVALDPGPPIRDADGALAVLDVRRRCGETIATIVRASAASHPVDAVTPVSEPVIHAEPLPPGVRCQGFAPAEPPYDFIVLGFAPQGLVAARLGEVRVAPLTVDAAPAGDPQDLPGATPLPAPLHGGLVTRDGAVYVLPSPHGLLRLERATGEVALLRAPEWTGRAPIAAAAIAPSGRRAAVLRGGAIWVLEL